jgi:hypothetical protein
MNEWKMGKKRQSNNVQIRCGTHSEIFASFAGSGDRTKHVFKTNEVFKFNLTKRKRQKCNKDAITTNPEIKFLLNS